MAKLGTSGLQRLSEKIKDLFVLRDEVTSVIEKDLLKVTIGTEGSYNSTGDRYLAQLPNHGGRGAKLIMIFDSNGALGISASIDNDGNIENGCTRCGRVTGKSGTDFSPVFTLNITKAMGAPAYYIVLGEN